MDFMHQDANTVLLTEIFNEEHAANMFEQKLQTKPNFNKLIMRNVGVKVMKDAFQKFKEQGVTEVQIEYNWNDIMMMPKLVCYDKNTWKTMQQLVNWNTEWSNLFKACYTIQVISINLTCSWADDQMVKALLEGIVKLPNIKSVAISVRSKNSKTQEMLTAFEKAQIFSDFKYQYLPYEEK